MKLILGIDPGLTGALALIRETRSKKYELEEIIDVPLHKSKRGKNQIDVHTLAQRLSFYKGQIAFAVIEEVHSMPDQSSQSTFTFGRSLGQMEALIAALFIPFFPVSPQAWKSAFNLSKDKSASISLALSLFPGSIDLFARKMDHNRAEAALLATYGALYLKEEFEALQLSDKSD